MITEFSAENLLKTLKLDQKKWNSVPSEKAIEKTAKAVSERGINVIVVDDGLAALEKIKELIPAGAEVMNGSSTTLNEIGFSDFLKSPQSKWTNLHSKVFAENDPAKRADLRRHATSSEYFLASVNAISQTGELLAVDASGSRVGAFPFAAKNLVLVSGANKIVASLDEAFKRIEKFVLPLENARAQKVYGSGSRLGKMVIFYNEGIKGRTTLILVKEKLGY